MPILESKPRRETSDAASAEPGAASRRFNRAARPIPLGPILAAVVGAGLLGTAWLYRGFLRQWHDSLELGFITGASFLLIWGLTELIGGLFFRSAGWGQSSASAPPRLETVSWIGIVLVALGAGGFYLVDWESRLGVVPICLLVAGLGCLIYGGKRFVDRLLLGQAASVERQTVALTVQGAVCLVVAVVFLLGAFIGPSNMLMLMFAFVAGPFIMNGWFAFRMILKLKISRNLPAQVLAGEPLSVTITLANRKRSMSTWLMSVADSITRVSGSTNGIAAGRQRSYPGDRLLAETLFQRVPPRSSKDASYRVRLLRRGRYVFGPIRVRSRFPLGLVERGRIFAAPAEMIVAPRLGRLTDRWRTETMAAEELVQRQRPRRGVFPDEFEKLRGFRYGDNPRLIHWRTSARQNSLMIREYHEIRDRDLLILLDLARTDDSEQADLTIELAVSFAATLCIDQIGRSRQSRLAIAVTGHEFTNWTGTAHPASAEPLLGMLALVEAGPRPDLEPLWDFAHKQRTATTSGICLTTRPAAEVVRPAGANWIRTLVVNEQTMAEYLHLE